MGALATIHEGYSQDQISLIKQTVAKDATDLELALFLHQCNRAGLDPLAKQIHCVHRFNAKTGKKEMSIQTSIDGYRLIADRTGQYAGNDDYEFDDPEGQPKWAKSTVYKLVGGVRCPFSATARWSQYYPGEKQGFMWGKMPHVMLGKCAEALALRKAFPAEMSGVYTREEMQQADKVEEAVVMVEAQATADKYNLQAPVNTKEAAQELADAKIKALQGAANSKAIVEEMKNSNINTTFKDAAIAHLRSNDSKRPLAEQTAELLQGTQAKLDEGLISEAQVRKLWVTVRQQKHSEEGVRSILQRVAGVQHTKDIPKTKFNSIMEILQNQPPVEGEQKSIVDDAWKVLHEDTWSVSALATVDDYVHVTLLASDGTKVANAWSEPDLLMSLGDAKSGHELISVVMERTESKGAHKQRPVNKIVEFKVLPF